MSKHNAHPYPDTDIPATLPFGVGIVGAGYWGPNLVRNFRASNRWDVVAVCDLDAARAAKVIGPRSTIDIETSFEQLLTRPDVDAVAIATPARTHAALVLAALAAGKHVLVEKPIAETSAAAREMVAAAADAGRVLMVDHTYCYTPAVRYIADTIANGTLGDLLYVDSVRINLGLVQPDVNVFWDLAPHDLSILDFVLPGGVHADQVSAHGADPLGAGRECVGHLTMPVANGGLANVHVNWLSPVKIRQMVIGGSKQTLVWDDLNPQQRIAVYDRGVDLGIQAHDAANKSKEAKIAYRLGDIHIPALAEKEALANVVTEFADAIAERRAPLTDGAAGLRVLEVLEATDRSLERQWSTASGAPATLQHGVV